MDAQATAITVDTPPEGSTVSVGGTVGFGVGLPGGNWR
jgi:hypothetical protein